MFLNKYGRPKNGHTFEVIGVGRISTEHQDELSLGDQEALYREHIKRILPNDAKYEDHRHRFPRQWSDSRPS